MSIERKVKIAIEHLGYKNVYLGLGDLALILYYAKELDFNKGKNLYFRLNSEWSYFLEKNGITGSNNTGDENYSHFNATEIQDAIDFIEDFLIPALTNETVEELIDKYGGKDVFNELPYTDFEYIEIFPTFGEYWGYGPSNFIRSLEEIVEIFEMSLAKGEPYMFELD